jgi:hypothetical protein
MVYDLVKKIYDKVYVNTFRWNDIADIDQDLTPQWVQHNLENQYIDVVTRGPYKWSGKTYKLSEIALKKIAKREGGQAHV